MYHFKHVVLKNYSWHFWEPYNKQNFDWKAHTSKQTSFNCWFTKFGVLVWLVCKYLLISTKIQAGLMGIPIFIYFSFDGTTRMIIRVYHIRNLNLKKCYGRLFNSCWEISSNTKSADLMVTQGLKSDYQLLRVTIWLPWATSIPYHVIPSSHFSNIST